ncbi:MAG: class I SAM-dependent methyltransferase [Candidatus Daviesbacteria bacterium]|nr:class I SAM-dependent methyltransferase [Candidatus Daviesbacteria bacterium]
MNKAIVREGYNKIAEDYLASRDQFSNPKYLDKLNSFLKPNSTILDIGCGAGMPIDKFFVDRGHKVIGIDISEKQIKLAKKNIPQGQFEVKNMSDIKAGEYQVDAVVSFYAIFHISREEHEDLFKRINSFLPEGGLILVTMGAGEYEGLEDNFLGTKMWWSHYGVDKNREMIKNASFEILLDEVDASGNERHQIILAQSILKS